MDKALSDGIINQHQYEELISRSAKKIESEKRSWIQSSLIMSGVIVIVVVAIIAFLIEFRNMSYYTKLFTLGSLAVSMFIGSICAKKIGFQALHFGLLSGASNLIVFAYGYWFYYERYYYNSVYGELRESVRAANRDIILVIPIIVVPIIILCYLIYRNSRLGSQGALMSLAFGFLFFLSRATSWRDRYFPFETVYLMLGIIGAGLFITIILINILWRRKLLIGWKQFYEERLKTFHSLLSSGYVLGSAYILFSFVVFSEAESGSFSVGAGITTFLAFFVILYGIRTKKDGLVLSACGIIIISTWIVALSSYTTGICFIVPGITTAVILIGIAFILRRRQEHEKEGNTIYLEKTPPET